ncbi:thermonuclease family protein [Mycoplasma sp. 480]|uniref:thermonuclease family protein n=1 Tax=Mycoplasma sp. 480 TaxID=3440155 RepID=UPI003F5174CB
MKKIIKATSLVVFPYIAIPFVVSCNNNEAKYFKESTDLPPFEKLNAKIVKWKDGDTPVLDFGDNQTIEGQQSIRVAGIDTPEKNLGKDHKIDDFEKSWAEKASKFGENTLPPGTEVTFIYGSKVTRSYERVVGWIFYKQNNIWKDYSVEIIREGLTLPNIKKAWDVSFKTNVEYYEGIKMWNAFYNAIENHRNFYQNINSESELYEFAQKVYKSRGVPQYQAFLKSTEDNVLSRHKTNVDNEESEKNANQKN